MGEKRIGKYLWLLVAAGMLAGCIFTRQASERETDAVLFAGAVSLEETWWDENCREIFWNGIQ